MEVLKLTSEPAEVPTDLEGAKYAIRARTQDAMLARLRAGRKV